MACLYVPINITCFTNNFAAPFELTVAVFRFSDSLLFISSPAAELIAAICASRTGIALTAFRTQGASLHVRGTEVRGFF